MKLKLLAAFGISFLVAVAQPTSPPSGGAVTANQTSGLLISPPNFFSNATNAAAIAAGLSGSFVTPATLNGYFADPTTNGSFAPAAWRSGLSLAAIATSGSASDLGSGTVPDARFPATLPVASGANLTALNASNLATGTIPDARFPATLPVASGANLTALNADNLASGTLPDARFPATLPVASGANLTALNANNLGSGTVPDARFPATLPVASGANLTALNASNLASGTVPDARFPATLPVASGINLTALNATNLASGTVPDARFPATLPVISGANLTALNATNLSSGTLATARLPAFAGGDASTSAGSGVITLATVNSSPGSFGSATQVPALTVDGKGRITAIANTTITQPLGGNPTASVGLTAVNGSASTHMRSDGAPALDQSIAPTWTGLHTYSQAGIGTSPASPVALRNSTAAAAGSQQYSPSIEQEGQGWKTTATAASQSVKLRRTLRPVQGTSAPTWQEAWEISINGGAYSDVMLLTSPGDMTIAGTTYGFITNSNSNRILFRTDGGQVIDLTGAVDGSGNFRMSSALQLDGMIQATQATVGNRVQALISTATNSDPTETFVQNRVATTDATVTTLHTITIPSTVSATIECTVTARRTGGAAGTANDSASYRFLATVKDVSGTATIVGSVSALATQEDQAAWDATLDVTGGTARVRVTGAANNNITWHLSVRIWSLIN